MRRLVVVAYSLIAIVSESSAQTPWRPVPSSPGMLSRTADGGTVCGYTVRPDGRTTVTVILRKPDNKLVPLQWNATDRGAAERGTFLLENKLADPSNYPVSIFFNACGKPDPTTIASLNSPRSTRQTAQGGNAPPGNFAFNDTEWQVITPWFRVCAPAKRTKITLNCHLNRVAAHNGFVFGSIVLGQSNGRNIVFFDVPKQAAIQHGGRYFFLNSANPTNFPLRCDDKTCTGIVEFSNAEFDTARTGGMSIRLQYVLQSGQPISIDFPADGFGNLFESSAISTDRAMQLVKFAAEESKARPLRAQQAKVEATRRAELERQRVAQARLADKDRIIRQLNIQQLSTIETVNGNPMLLKGTVVGVSAVFERMVSETDGIFTIGGCPCGPIGILMVAKTPPTRFRGGERMILAARVLGFRTFNGVSVPHIEFVGAEACPENNCYRFFYQ